MAKENIVINDFSLLVDALKAAVKVVDAAKLIIGPNGLEIYGAHGTSARCEIVTNAVHTAESTVEMCIDSLNNLNRVLATVKEVHANDFSDLEIWYSQPNLHFKSKKMKMKYSTCIESVISNWVSKKITTQMSPTFTFKTSSDMIKRINAHAFLFNDAKSSANVYLETKDDMEVNSVFATLGNRNVDLGKEITLKFGLVVDGKLAEGRTLVIDIERMNLFNIIQSDDITISLMDKNVLLSTSRVAGKNGSYFSSNLYCTLLKG